jgi:hypothetical protein
MRDMGSSVKKMEQRDKHRTVWGHKQQLEVFELKSLHLQIRAKVLDVTCPTGLGADYFAENHSRVNEGVLG